MMKIKNEMWNKLIDEFGMKVRVFDEGYKIYSARYEYNPGDSVEMLRICENGCFSSFYVATKLTDYSTINIGVNVVAGCLVDVKSYEQARNHIGKIINQIQKCKEKLELKRIKKDFK